MRLLDRIVAAFVEPVPAAEAASVRWEPPTAPVGAPSAALGPRRVAVLCAPRDARLAGGAAGMALARRCSAPAVAVAEWGAAPVRPAPRAATPAATRLAAVLSEHGLAAMAVGRLARVAVPCGEAEAVGALRLLLDECPAPLVLGLAAARRQGVDELLARSDRVLVCTRDDADRELAHLAAAGLEASGVASATICLAAPPVAAALARAGVALVSPLREAFGGALGPC